MGIKLKNILISNSPEPLQKKLIQNNIEIPLELNPQLEIKIAETFNEYESALHLLYSNYIEMGYEKPNSTLLRVLPHHMLPTTTTLIAKLNNEVVGSMSIIKDSSLGLPMESSVDLKEIKTQKQKIAEISSLAIRKDVRRAQGGMIFFPLLKFMYEYCVKYADIENLAILVRPHVAYFYKSLLQFTEIPNSLGTYLGVDTVGLTLNLNEALSQFEKIYSKKPLPKNLYHFFVQKKFDQLRFPKRDYSQTNDTSLTPELIRSFFLERACIADKLSLRDYLIIKNIYRNTAIYPVFSEFENSYLYNNRKSPRFEVKMQSLIHLESFAQDFDVETISVSLTGIKVKIKSLVPSLSKGETLSLQVQLSPHQKTQIKARMVWRNGLLIAFEVVSSTPEWVAMISELTKNHNYQSKAA